MLYKNILAKKEFLFKKECGFYLKNVDIYKTAYKSSSLVIKVWRKWCGASGVMCGVTCRGCCGEPEPLIAQFR